VSVCATADHRSFSSHGIRFGARAIHGRSASIMLMLVAVIPLEKQWRYGEALATGAGVAAIAGGAILVLRATIRA
jgi:hypothetical protein